MSGMDCGEELDCRSENGSGFFTFDAATVLGVSKPVIYAHWVFWHAHGNDHYTIPGMFKWLTSMLTHNSALPEACTPGCQVQYTFPTAASSRRLLFASQPDPEPIIRGGIGPPKLSILLLANCSRERVSSCALSA
jgi:hypothetical protein